MSFRQPKSDRHARDRAWQSWLSRHQAALREVGLSPSVILSEDHWTDFLQNGYLERHPESNDGFAFDQMTPGQMLALLRVLEASPQYALSPLVRWLRHRVAW